MSAQGRLHMSWDRHMEPGSLDESYRLVIVVGRVKKNSKGYTGEYRGGTVGTFPGVEAAMRAVEAAGNAAVSRQKEQIPV